ncbi:hypothetical protein ACGFR6_33100 [Streptomyces sp. NPDC048567]|uniref:hypothetical protein n=1 Tax=Streptomyces sp. NPDC048567 TaxID=3365570 RepID=UPI00371BE00A
MSGSRALSLSLVGLAAVGVVLTGCSSDDGESGKSAPGGKGGAAVSKGGKGSAKLAYSGGASGEVVIESVGCAVMGGKLTAVTAPDSADSGAPAKPSFTAVLSGDKTMSTLTTKDGTGYVQSAGSGVSGFKSGDTWVVNVDGLTLGPTDLSGEPITVDGTITCGSVAGA